MDPETLRLLIQAAPTALLVTQAGGGVILANQAAGDLTGYDPAELANQPLEILLPERLRATHEDHREAFAKDPRVRPMGDQRDLILLHRDGREIPVEVGLSPIQTPSGLLVICTLLDLTPRARLRETLLRTTEELKERNRELADLVATDSLTSLRSRQAFMDHLTTQLESAVRNARPLSLLILDVDYFKAYNDEFGHLAGDEVLRSMGKTLLDASRRSDVVARLGGEEFGVLLPETDAGGAKVFGERFRQAVESVSWPRRAITVSVGATTVTFDTTVPRPKAPSVSRILNQADQALYRSKDTGRNRVTHFQDLPSEKVPAQVS